jgi:hypothetical protein
VSEPALGIHPVREPSGHGVRANSAERGEPARNKNGRSDSESQL